jgi:Protein of unknown function (DUF2782)
MLAAGLHFERPCLFEKKSMLRKSPVIVFACLAIFAARIAAAPPADLEELPAPLPPPDLAEPSDELEPDITIIQRKDATVEEYRLNGRLYMIKVTPVVGKPYYFVDRDGDGLMESKMSDLYNVDRVPQWVIFSW